MRCLPWGDVRSQLRDCVSALYECYRLDLWHPSLFKRLLERIRVAPRTSTPPCAPPVSSVETAPSRDAAPGLPRVTGGLALFARRHDALAEGCPVPR